MLHKLLNLTRSCFVLDTETTGTDVQSDRIIEIGFQQWTADGMVKEWRTLVDPGIPIPAEATRVHHITDADVKDAYTFRQLAPSLAKGFVDCDWCGQNVRFDLRILSAEFARAGVPWSYTGARIIDSLKLEQLAVPRSLSHLHEKYVGHKHDGAHGALSDVRAASVVISKQLEMHESLPRSLDALHALQWPGMIDPDDKFRFVDGVPCFSNWGKHANKPMTSADEGYWDFILKGTFGPDAKQLARDAKLGKFPKEKRA